MRDDDDVAVRVGSDDGLDRSHTASRGALALLAAGREVPGGVLVAEQLHRLGVVAQDLLEVLLLPLAAEPLAQVIVVHDSKPV